MIARIKLISDVFDDGFHVIEVDDLPVVLGRSKRADITIHDGMLSRLHSEIRMLPMGSVEVRDLDSTNLTIVNKQDVSQSILQDGDILLIGDTEIRIALELADGDSLERTTRDLTMLPGPTDETVADG